MPPNHAPLSPAPVCRSVYSRALNPMQEPSEFGGDGDEDGVRIGDMMDEDEEGLGRGQEEQEDPETAEYMALYEGEQSEWGNPVLVGWVGAPEAWPGRGWRGPWCACARASASAV